MDYVPYREAHYEPPAQVRSVQSCDVTGASLRGAVSLVQWRPSSASVRWAPEPVVRSLQQLFVFRGYSEVERMTEGNPQLVPLLLEARQQIARVFGPDAPLVLEVVPNPEASDALPELFLYIQTRLSVRDAKEKLAQLDDEWWLDALPRSEGRLNLALEYV
jgi:hypothetical protein